MKNQHIVFTVTNDLIYDQRMHRICSALTEHGFHCTLIGRKRRKSEALQKKPFNQKRLFCFFERGKGFYIEYNIRLFFTLLTTRADVVCAIDLDTALPAWAAARIKGLKLYYDAHEYFSELEEVISRPMVHKFWQWVEDFMMKRCTRAYTISQGYADLFKERYKRDFVVVRNVPYYKPSNTEQLPGRFIIYQGALNIGRGLEESILSMKKVEGLSLKIFGDGPLRGALEELIDRHDLHGKVELCGPLLPEALRQETSRAFAGLTLFSDIGLHHHHSLANRFFDYMHAGIPQIGVNYAEYRNFNDAAEVAVLIEKPDADAIADAINKLNTDPELWTKLSDNSLRAAQIHNWQKESEKLVRLYLQP